MPGFPLKLTLLTAAFMSALLNAQTTTLSYTPVGAEYSAALDRIIMVSANPNQLHIYNPATQSELQVGLPKPPLTLSVSPDGMYAAVGHDALISYVNLAGPSIVQTYNVAFTVQAVVLGPSWIYVLAPNVISINIVTDATTAANFENTGSTTGRLDTPLNAIYSAGGSGLLEYDISTGPITSQFSFTYNTPICGGIFLSPDGSRLYDDCATAFTILSGPTPSAAYLTTFTGMTSVGALAAACRPVRTACFHCRRKQCHAAWQVGFLQSRIHGPVRTHARADILGHLRWFRGSDILAGGTQSLRSNPRLIDCYGNRGWRVGCRGSN